MPLENQSRTFSYRKPEPEQPAPPNSFTFEEAMAARPASFTYEEAMGLPPAEPERTVGGSIKDVGIAAATGIVRTGQAAVGLANLATGGLAGKGMDKIGYDPEATSEFLEGHYSDAQKAANQRLSEAEGFTDTVKTMVQNPSTIGKAIIESIPMMMGGGAIARAGLGALKKVAPKIAAKRGAALTAGGAGEGTIAGGFLAENIRQQTEDKELTLKQGLMAAGGGLGTGIFGVVGGRIAQRLGVIDPDTWMAGGASAVLQKEGVAGVAKRIVGGGISEGLFEELPQEAQETMWENAALDRPIFEGVPEAAAQGLVVGAAMGAGMNVIPDRQRNKIRKALEDPTVDPGQRAAAANAVWHEINKKSPELAEGWRMAVQDAILGERPVTLEGYEAFTKAWQDRQQKAETATTTQTTDTQTAETAQTIDTTIEEPPAGTIAKVAGDVAPPVQEEIAGALVEEPLPDWMDTTREGPADVEMSQGEQTTVPFDEAQQEADPTQERELLYDITDTMQDVQDQADVRTRKNKFEQLRRDSTLSQGDKERLEAVVGAVKEAATSEDISRLSAEVEPFFAANPKFAPYREMVEGAIAERAGALTQANNTPSASAPASASQGVASQPASPGPDQAASGAPLGAPGRVGDTVTTNISSDELAARMERTMGPESLSRDIEVVEDKAGKIKYYKDGKPATQKDLEGETSESYQVRENFKGETFSLVEIDPNDVSTRFSHTFEAHVDQLVEAGVENLPPPVVHLGKRGKLEKIDGAHRLEAARKAGLKKISVYMPDSDIKAMADKAKQSPPDKETAALPGREVGEGGGVVAELRRKVSQSLKKHKDSEAQTDAIMALVEARAASAGMSTEDYINTRGLEVVPDSQVADQKTRQDNKGAVGFTQDGRAIIHAFEKADVSTLAHEIGHVFRRDLNGADLATTENWAGVKDGQWDDKAEEKFARAWEKYLRSGDAPTKGMAKVFAQFKQWLTDIYQALTGSPLAVRISPEMKQVFDRLLTPDAMIKAKDARTPVGEIPISRTAPEPTDSFLFQLDPEKWSSDQNQHAFSVVNNRLSKELEVAERLLGPISAAVTLPGAGKQATRSIKARDLGQALMDAKESGLLKRLIDPAVNARELAAERGLVGKERVAFLKEVKDLRSGPLYHDTHDNGRPILSGNGKATASVDFILGTCQPTTPCQECYAAASMIRMSAVKKAMRSTIHMLVDPVDFGRRVAGEVKKVSKAKLPFVRLLGSGDLTTDEAVEAFNTLAKHADRPLQIFSRHHDNLARLKGTKVAPFLKMGSIDADLFKHYGIDWLKKNMTDRSINNAFLYSDPSELPALQEMFDANAIGLVLSAEHKLHESLPADIKQRSCPCDAGERTYLGSCRRCALSMGGCFTAFGDKAVDDQGNVWAIDDKGMPKHVQPVLSFLADFRPKPGTTAQGVAYANVAADSIQKSIELIGLYRRQFEKGEKIGITLKDINWPDDVVRLVDIDAFRAKYGKEPTDAGDTVYLSRKEVLAQAATEVARLRGIKDRALKEGTFFLPGGEIQKGVAFKKGERLAAPELISKPAAQGLLFQDATTQTDTNSPAFKRWFAGSKVVDADGAPLVVYHGGPKTLANGVFRIPAFFTQDKDGAQWYVDNRGEGDGAIHEVYVSIKNPLNLDNQKDIRKLFDIAKSVGVEITENMAEAPNGWEFHSPAISEHSPYDGDNQVDLAYVPAVREALLKNGYDGFVLSDVLENTDIPTYVAFDPTQIKSIHNQGTWDATNPDIQKSTSPLPPANQATRADLTREQQRILAALESKGTVSLVTNAEAMAVLQEAGLSAEQAAKYMVAWHGSPHDHDGFKTEKIGTGEGAQAYGQGLYFSSVRDVAEFYAEKLSNSNSGGLRLAGNVPTSPDKGLSDNAWRSLKDLSELLVSDTTVVKPFSKLDVVKQRRVLTMMHTLLEDRKVLDAVVGFLPVDVVNMFPGMQWTPERLLNNPTVLVHLLPADTNDLVPASVKAIDILAPSVAIAAAKTHTGLVRFDLSPNDFFSASGTLHDNLHEKFASKIPHPYEFVKGFLYQVELAPAQDEYLLWDRPLSEQSEKVKKAIGFSTDIAGLTKDVAELEAQIAKVNAEPTGLSLAREESNNLSIQERIRKASDQDINKRKRHTTLVDKLLATQKRLDLAEQGNITGREFYKNLERRLGSAQNASLNLHSLGIRGIKYLDGTSRSKGEGAYNYVIFDDKDIQIIAKFSKQGKIQGFALPDGRTFVVPENVEKGKLWSVLRHEVGVHLRKLAQSDKAFQKILDSIESRKDEQSATGEAIRRAMARVPKDTKAEHKSEETLAYLIENSPEIGLARRFIALIKRLLVKMGFSRDMFTVEDYAAMADAALRSEAGGTMTEAVSEFAQSARLSLAQAKRKIQNLPAFKKWFEGSKVVDEKGAPLVVYHGTPFGNFLERAKKINAKRRETKGEYEALKLDAASAWELYREIKNELEDHYNKRDSIAKEIDQAPILKRPGLRQQQIETQRRLEADKVYAYSLVKELESRKKDTGSDIVMEQEEIDAFLRTGDNDSGYLGRGFYFTADEGVAGNYAKMTARGRLPGEVKDPYVYEVFLNLKNPFYPGKTEITPEMAKVEAEFYERYKPWKPDLDGFASARSWARTDMLKQFGFDGVIGESAGKEGTEYVVFEPTQIKSIFNTKWDGSNPDIMMSMSAPTPEFTKWFAKSKVTENGQPKVVFHGSPTFGKDNNFTFDPDRATGKTKTPGRGLGTFFASDRTEAVGYAGTEGEIQGVFLRVENPLVINSHELPNFASVEAAKAYRRVQQKAGHDGIHIKDEDHWVIFDAGQAKSADKNSGAYSRGDNDIRFSQAPSPHNWDAPLDSRKDTFLYNAQNKFIDLFRVQEAIQRIGGIITEDTDVRLAEEVYHKRAATRVKDFLRHEVQPLMQKLSTIDKNDKEFERFLWARHAEEANESLRKRNPTAPELKAMKDSAEAERNRLLNRQIVKDYLAKEREVAVAKNDVELGNADDSLESVVAAELAQLKQDPTVQAFIKAREMVTGLKKVKPFVGDNTWRSGMKNQEAQDFMAALPADKRQAYTDLAGEWDALIGRTRQSLVDYGLESQETVDAWAAAYQYYIPLQREDMDGGKGIGQGFSVKGSSTKARTGSDKAVVDVLANILIQRERSIVRGEKSQIARALYGLAEANPNPEFWSTEIPPKERTVDQVTGLVVERADMGFKNKPNVVVARLVDANGQIEEKAVVFNEQDSRALRMAEALKNLDTDQIGTILGASSVVTRWFSAINTQYNIIFGVVNLARDAQAAMLNLSTTPLAGRQRAVAKAIPKLIPELYKAVRAETAGTPRQTTIAKAWREMQLEGGTTGFRDMFETSEDRANRLRKDITEIASGRPLKTLRNLKQWVSDYNDVLENSTRLAVYMEAKAQGLTNKRAAQLAKDITLNFNRKGKVASQAGALYAFYNAASQGTEKMYRTMTGPAGKKILAGGLILGAAQTLLLAAAGFDEDEPPEFIRERNTIIPIGGKKYITIPMPLGFHAIPNLSRVPMEWALSGFKDPGKRVVQLAAVFAEAFNPLGNAGFSIQTIAPTPIDPFVALTENRDWTGKPIAKPDFNSLKPTPGHTRARDTASWLSATVSKGLNYLTGGNEYVPGMLSPTPDQIDYLAGQILGGVGRETGKLLTATTGAVTGEAIPSYKIPLVGRFYGDATGNAAIASRFYSNIKALNRHDLQIDGLRESGGDVMGYLQKHPEARLIKLTGRTYREVQKLQRYKRLLLREGAGRSKIVAVEERIAALMQQVNSRIEKLEG